MKERFLNVLKWFFITLGVLFLIQLLLALGMIIGVSKFNKADINIVGNSTNKLKEAQNIIDYIEDYYNKNNTYPKEVKNIKLKKHLEYKYEPSKDNNCYTLTLTNKKNNVIKQYQRCFIKAQNSSSNSESYVEYIN